jgi:hypothetical protein
MADEPAFGAELRRRRLAAGLSLAELARQVHYSKGHLSKIENDAGRASVPLARLCDSVLAAGGELAARLDQAEPAPPAEPAEPTGDGGPWLLGLGGAEDWFQPETGVRSPAGAFALTAQPRAAGPELEIAYTAIFHQLREFGRREQPAAVLPLLVAQIAALRRFAAAAEQPTRHSLLSLSARCAEFAGWMAQEGGDGRQAAWWTGQAERVATEVGDHDLAAYALVRQAELALYREDPRRTVELAVRAGRRSDVSARTRALAAHREAQGHALAGDTGPCERALNRADDLLGEAAGERDGGLGPSTVADLGAIVAGWCAYDLGSPTAAIERLEAGLATIPTESVRVRAVFGARLALAHEAAGHHDTVDHLAEEILAVAPLIESASVRSQLRILARAMGRGASRTRAPALRAAVAEALREPGPG